MCKRNVPAKVVSMILAAVFLCMTLAACGNSKNSGKTTIEIVNYKQEAVDYFDQLQDEFNKTHSDIELTISSPNDAMTVLKTRFVREDYPDIIAIGGDVNYSNFVDAGILADVSGYEGLSKIKTTYVDMLENLEFVPTDGTYGIPYAANAAGILYNKDMFKKYGWEIPTTWSGLIKLCKQIQADGELPFYMGYKDTWTCLAPWNSACCSLAPADVCQQVNRGETTFAKEYDDVAAQVKELLAYGEKNPVAYGYNDACTAFAKGDSAMYIIGNYAVPQIKSVNPDMNIGSFTYPATENDDDNILVSGVDLQFCITEACPNKKAAYEVLDFLLQDDTIQGYLDSQDAVPCKTGDFKLSPILDGVAEKLETGKVADYQDHHYPSEMTADALIQTYLLDDSANAKAKFLKNFDTQWVRYNRDLIQQVKEYDEAHSNS